MIGGAPTPFEFMQSYMEQALAYHKEKDFIYMMATYLSKMCLHHEKLCNKQSNLLGASSVYVALKICEQMRQKTFITKPLLQGILDVSGIEERKLIDCSKNLLYLAQNFEKELPGLQNLKNIYIPKLNSFVAQQWKTKEDEWDAKSHLTMIEQLTNSIQIYSPVLSKVESLTSEISVDSKL